MNENADKNDEITMASVIIFITSRLNIDLLRQ